MNIVGLVNEGLAGGVLRVALEETVYLNLLGENSILLTSYTTPSLKRYLKGKTRTYAKLDFGCSPPLSYVGSFLREFSGGVIEPKIPHNFRPDWIICHNLCSIRDAFRLAAKNGAKVCAVIHNPSFPPSLFNIFLHLFGLERRKYMEIITRLLQRVDLTLTTNVTLGHSFFRQFGIRSKVLRLACDPLDKIPEKRGDFILCASRISLGKRVDQVAEIIASIDKNYPVVFAGATHATTSEVVRRIRKTGLRNVKLAFNVSDGLLDKLYASCRFFMGFSSGLPPLEAASHGAPIVCDNNSWANEYFLDGIHGYIYENAEELALRCVDDISKLMSDERTAWTMGYKGWQLCRERYTWRHHVKYLLSLLDEA